MRLNVSRQEMPASTRILVQELATNAQFPRLPLASIETVTHMPEAYTAALWIASTFSAIPYLGADPSRERSACSRIVGSGEMAELIRAFDWTKTSVGPGQTWSDTLITTVNLLLASRHPMFPWWGSGLIQFYNDGYRPSIREDKHPSAIGQRIECWPEIWPIVGPQIREI
jgi:hypothetical protein